jgi:hypothetical protein
MARKAEKFLVETSAVRPALGDSTARHCEHFQDQVSGGTLSTSVYIRMEFLRRWFCDAVRLALVIDQCGDVAEALVRIEQDFRPRSIKGLLAVVAKHLRDRGTLANAPETAEEVAHLALRWLKRFDRVFPGRIRNACRCRVGAMTPQVNHNRVLADLRLFRDAFLTPVTDCEVNAFLGFDEEHGRSAVLLEDAGVSARPVGGRLRELYESRAWVTCRECATIGDVVIALEQPAACCLVHVDAAFNDLCRATGRRHRAIQSVAAVEREQRRSKNR